MRQSVKRTGYLVAAVLLTLAGVVFATGTASADRESNNLLQTTRLQACAFPTGCPQDVRDLPANSEVFTFCVSDAFNLVYSGPNSGRGGFVSRSVLRQPDEQTDPCDDSGGFGQVNTEDEELTLTSCSGPCVNFGDVEFGDLVRVFCELEGSYLVHHDRTGRAGFLETSAVNTVGGADDCNP